MVLDLPTYAKQAIFWPDWFIFDPKKYLKLLNTYGFPPSY